MKKTNLLLFAAVFLMLCSTVAFAAIVETCSADTVNETNVNYTNVSNGTANVITVLGTSCTVANITSIVPTVDFTTVLNRTIANMTCGINWTIPYMCGVEFNSLNITNTSNTSQALPASNYTFNETSGLLVIATGCNSSWNGTNTSITYFLDINVTSAVTDLENATCWGASFVTETISGTKGANASWLLNIPLNDTTGLDGYNWTITYNSDCDNCTNTTTTTAAGSCRAVQTTIWSAFSLIALMAVIAAAFLLFNIFNGGNFSASMTIGLTIAIIGLGIVLFVGYVIIRQVSIGVCGG